MQIREFGSGYLGSIGNICAFGMSVAEVECHFIAAGLITLEDLCLSI